MAARFRIIAEPKLKYIISGNPGGGTRFISKFLTKCGLLCGHEQIAIDVATGQLGTFDMQAPGEALAEDLIADSSYVYTKYANFGILKTLPVIMLLRNPVAIANSLIWIEIENNRTVDVNVILKEVAQRYVDLEVTGRVVYRCRIEEPDDLEGLCKYFKLPVRLYDNIDRHRHNKGRINMKRRDFDSISNCKLLDDIATTYGYRFD